MKDLNKVFVAGRITRHIEVKQTESGKAYCRYSIAVKGNGEETMFVDCVAFDKTAETMEQYIEKGQKVVVDGHLITRTVKNRETGKERTVIELMTDSIHFDLTSRVAVDPEKQVKTQADIEYKSEPMDNTYSTKAMPHREDTPDGLPF